MARFLFTPGPVTGPMAPALELARGTVERGHDVTVLPAEVIPPQPHPIGS